ncbi:SufE family protein [Chitinilyticum aquatile]|uniref:SufE family protein n=1 Tax=Chitinilyticum aquatile TaxID=362520 RepID=UPI000421516A|nr:SufE family protein [Chitinilyticum aquatile]
MNDAFPDHPFGTRISRDELTGRLAHATGWEAKNRLLVQLGRDLPDWPADARTDDRLVSGCESRVWLAISRQGSTFALSADSDSRIIKGLLALVLTAFHGRSANEIATFDLEHWIGELGLLRFLSASRGNGLRAIVLKIREIASIQQ